jgi:hypothetical protein
MRLAPMSLRFPEATDTESIALSACCLSDSPIFFIMVFFERFGAMQI